MAGSALKQGTGKELKRLVAMLSGAIAETLGSLVGRELLVRPLEAEAIDAEGLLAKIERPCAVARGALDKGYAGKSLLTLFELPDAISMAGMLMMTPEHVINQRRADGTMVGEDAEAFAELGNVLYSGFGNVLRDAVENVDVRMQDHGIVKPGLDPGGILGEGALIVVPFRLKVADNPESIGFLVLDFATAEAWNNSPIEVQGGPAAPATATPEALPTPSGTVRVEDDGLETIPAAPIRGRLAAFVTQPEVFRILRKSCRRVGLELRRHGRGEIPNPAAHRGEIVLIDVPATGERRFDWCRRVKEIAQDTKVALLLHHPSRGMVTQAFLSKADAILGFPCEEPQLSAKLLALAADLPEPTPTAGGDG